MHEAEDAAGAEGATDGVADVTEGAAGGVEISEGAAAEGATTATFSWTPTLGKAPTGTTGVADDEVCTTGDALDVDCVVELSSEAPGTVQPMGVHSIPWTRPSPFGAIL